MANKIQIKTPEDNAIHFSYSNGLTLCNLEELGDSALGLEPGRFVRARVTCPHCVAIVEFCKGIRKSEIFAYAVTK